MKLAEEYGENQKIGTKTSPDYRQQRSTLL